MHLVLWGKSLFRYIRLGYNGSLLYIPFMHIRMVTYFHAFMHYLIVNTVWVEWRRRVRVREFCNGVWSSIIIYNCLFKSYNELADTDTTSESRKIFNMRKELAQWSKYDLMLFSISYQNISFLK